MTPSAWLAAFFARALKEPTAMKIHIERDLPGLALLLSVAIHVSAAFVGYAHVEPAKLKAVQVGRASISFRASIAAAPAPPQPVEQPKQAERKKAEAPITSAVPRKIDKAPAKSETIGTRAEKVPKPAIDPSTPETPKINADRISRPSRGSAGSRGAEMDGPAKPLASNAAPLYPPEALAAGLEGAVELLIKIDAGGKVVRVSVYRSSGLAAFDESALEAVQQWEFEPAHRNGVPVPSQARKLFNFEIRRR